jgi:ATP-dependent DNA ligase
MKIIFPPRPKGKMLPTDLRYYEETGDWVAQRKFRGSRIVLHISCNKEVTVGTRHGTAFSKFQFESKRRDELLDSLNLEQNKEYWLDGELMNKDINATNEIIFFDVLQAGRYLFFKPTQVERLEILNSICGSPTKKSRSGIALEISPSHWMAETFYDNFSSRFDESLDNPQLEGLLLRKKNVGIESLGEKEYETTNLIRCRKPFSKTKGYEF